jgi:hypothetical protein
MCRGFNKHVSGDRLQVSGIDTQWSPGEQGGRRALACRPSAIRKLFSLVHHISKTLTSGGHFGIEDGENSVANITDGVLTRCGGGSHSEFVLGKGEARLLEVGLTVTMETRLLLQGN